MNKERSGHPVSYKGSHYSLGVAILSFYGLCHNHANLFMFYYCHSNTQIKLEYCFAREKEIVFAQHKQSVPMSINEFVEMTIFLYLICFSIYDKMQGFIDESGLLIFFFFLRFTEKFKMAAKSRSRLCRYPAGQKFRRNLSLLLCF